MSMQLYVHRCARACEFGSEMWKWKPEHVYVCACDLVDVYGVVLPDYMLKTLSEAFDRSDILFIFLCFLEEPHGLPTRM